MAQVLDSLYVLFKVCEDSEVKVILLLGYLTNLKDSLDRRRIHGLQTHEDYEMSLTAMDCIRRNLEFVTDKSLRICFDSLREEFGRLFVQ
jgi:hypothetical protein